MKTLKHLFIQRLFPVLAMLLAAGGATAQDAGDGGFYTVSGVVSDGRRGLDNASVTLVGTNIGTVTNADGAFALKVPATVTRGALEFSFVGYASQRVAVEGRSVDIRVSLSGSRYAIGAVTVENRDALSIVERSLALVGRNYSDRPVLLTGFYRETVRKRSNYVTVSEAVTETYKTPYTFRGVNADRTQIVRGRQLESMDPRDTVAVKLQGGPNVFIFADIVKNDGMVLVPTELWHYRFTLDGATTIDDRGHYVIRFAPAVILEDRVLYAGTLWIDQQTYAISRAEYALETRDREAVTGMILVRKPQRLRFTPEEVSYIASYRQVEGRSQLNYIRNTVRFRADWTRRLFSTAYAVVSEMVVTDSRSDGVENIPLRESFRQTQSLSDRVSAFYDDGFWGSYNIIEPTESLENAVDKLIRRQE